MAKTDFKFFSLILKKRAAVFVIALGAIFCFLAVWYVYLPCPGGGPAKEVVIEKGSGLPRIAAVLKQSGLIKSKLFFGAYAFFSGERKNIQAGVYDLSPNLNVPRLLHVLVIGATKKPQITVAEGKTAEEILSALIEKKIIQPEDLPAVDVFRAKEGFLFPDTYEFNPGTQPAEILSVMLDNFDRKVGSDLRAEIEKQGRTLRDVVAMASILEKEVKTYQDKQMVAGILWKRLANNWYLQVDSAQETYHGKGLPPAPVCNPGLLSIKAAIYYKESGFWYYLSKPSGETVFSETLEEHNMAKAKYLK